MYTEPAEELSEDTRTFTRVCQSMVEEAQAIDSYEQRLSLEKNDDAVEVMGHAQREEFRHFCMDLEFLMRSCPEWQKAAQEILFKTGSIGEKTEGEKSDDGDGDEGKSGEKSEPESVEGESHRLGEPANRWRL